MSDCDFPWKGVQIATDGGVKPCCYARDVVGSVAANHVDEVWNGPVMRRLRRAIRDGYVHPICRGAACSFALQSERRFGLQAYDLRYEIGRRVKFRKGMDDLRYLINGWSVPEDWGVWSDGRIASIAFNLSTQPNCPLELSMEARGFCAKGHRRTQVDVDVNGHILDRWSFTVLPANVRKTLKIPVKLVSPLIKVTFRIRNPVSPVSLGLSEDTRLLGLAVQRTWFRRAS